MVTTTFYCVWTEHLKDPYNTLDKTVWTDGVKPFLSKAKMPFILPIMVAIGACFNLVWVLFNTNGLASIALIL